MGIKYCKACKKPMKATDTHCKTCGAEYKNNPIIILVILTILIAIGLAVYFLSKGDSSKPATPDAPSLVKKDIPSDTTSNWILDSSSDPISGVQTHAATVQASDFNTKGKVDSEFTIACRSNTGITNVVMAATYPMKTDSFSSDGPMARYYMKIDQNEH